MRHLFLCAALCCCTLPAAAQQDIRVYRAEVVPYDTRQSAEAGRADRSAHVIPFTPEPFMIDNDVVSMGAVVEMPYRWTDGCVYFHVENVGHAYNVKVNGQQVASTEDTATPADYDITPYIKEGANSIVVDSRFSRTPQVEEATPIRSRTLFENSYLYMQEKRSIADFDVVLAPDSTGKFGILDLQVVVRNAYNYEEPVTVGYDIASPDGKIQHFDFREISVAGRSTDTVRFSQPVYHTDANAWIDGKAPLYKVMLYTRRNDQLHEYMPLRVGFGRTELTDGKLTRLGRELQLRKAEYNAAADRATTLREIKELKAKGNNTLCPAYPQPAWFYDLCDELGVYVIDCANINAPKSAGDRTVGGTPSNDPALAEEYLARVKAMYSRSRNHTCIVAFALGGASGNGYNMYKAYEWLRAAEPSRPICYAGADGEWNSDL